MCAVPHIDRTALEQAFVDADCGEIRFDRQARALYTTDASNYRQVPLGAVLPRRLGDVEKALAVCRTFDVSITSRGGGTSLAGQCCNSGVILDFSKHLTRILEMNAAERFAWVEPGCVLDDLREAAKRQALTFGPDPSTHNHNTLGGMVGNNSCGVHSVMSGKTVDNIEALEILTFDGERLTVGPTSETDLASIIAAGGRRGQIYRDLAGLRDACAPLVRAHYPKIPRRVSGYNLDELLPENGFNVARALVGSEGTCVTVLRVKCRLVHYHPARIVVALGFKDVFTAADAVPRVLAARPIGLEGFDDKLVQYIRANHIAAEQVHLLPEGRGWLFAEFGAESREDAIALGQHLMGDMGRSDSAPAMRIVADDAEQVRIWKLREAALGATAHVPNMHDTYAGWEDAAVPPDRIGAYLRDFRKLLDRFGYDCALYGHFGDGCVHCSIDFDFSTRGNVAQYLRFIDAAADLVVAYGGSLSGEHGDGQSRATLLDKMFGPELVAAFATFKRIWDPTNRMNPGKMVVPYRPDENLREGPDHRPWAPATRLALPEDRHDFSRAATRCVGAGECRKHSAGVMCPSYMATRDEQHSTRGRARLLFEMTKGDVIRDRWRSREVHDALDLCLSCKACRSECPVRVDMASYKAEFMYHHYRGRLRPRSAYSMGWIWWWARAGSHWPAAANLLTQSGALSPIAKWAAGFAPARQIPPFARTPFSASFTRRRATSRQQTKGPVLLWPDTFNSYFTPAPLHAAVEILERDGWAVEIPPEPLCCGRPLYGFGFLDLADRLWQRTLDGLRPYIRADVPIVAVEPACISAFRHELPQMRPRDRDAQRLSRQVVHLAEFLTGHGYAPPPMAGQALVHAHCHQRGVMNLDDMLALLRAGGLEVDLLDSGCCGMAGDYGFRKESYAISQVLAERSLLPRVRNAPGALVLADGFSCREQVRQATGRMPVTFAEALNRFANLV